MINIQDLYSIAKSRFDEAKILLENSKPDGAVYLCGYAMELMLKRQIVKILKWDGYPETNEEFRELQSFRLHNLDTLLHLSGMEKEIQNDTLMFTNWQIIHTWNSGIRYRSIGKIKGSEAKRVIEATRDIANYIIKK